MLGKHPDRLAAERLFAAHELLFRATIRVL
jgi:hypothetical protein